MIYEEEGFLSQEAERVACEAERRYKELFQVCREINRYAYERLKQFKVTTGDNQRMLAGILYVKAIETFQALFLLTLRGFREDTLVLQRVILETVYNLVICYEDWVFYCFYQRYSDAKDKIFLTKMGLDYPDDVLPALKDFAKPEKISAAEIRLKGIKEQMEKFGLEAKFTKKDLAKKANLLFTYSSVYWHSSHSAHSSGLSLYSYMVTDGNGNIGGLKYGYDYKNVFLNLTVGGSLVLKAIEIISLFFDWQTSEDIERFQARLSEFREREERQD